jgi:tetratricopeptide (TPR) repeat protein
VTLYEAVTLEPAYPGTDREELLNQITHDEPPAPRRVNPSVPVALETIVLKAMAREPERRYATAEELADDLRRFLEDQPIRATRPTWRERLARWVWRRRAILSAAAGLFVVCLLLTEVFAWREKLRAEASVVRLMAEQRRTEENFHKALYGATEILKQLDSRSSGRSLEGEALRQALEEQGVLFYKQFIDETNTNPDPAVRYESARAYRLLATMYCIQQNAPQSQAMMGQAIALLEGLIETFPEEQSYQRELVNTFHLQGSLHTSLKQPGEARSAYARMVGLIHRVRPDRAEAETLNYYAWFLVDCPDEAFHEPDLAISLVKRAIALVPKKAKYWNTLGVAQYRLGDLEAAIATLHRSMELTGGGNPWDWFFLAMAYWKTGDPRQARAWYDRAVAWRADQPQIGELIRYRQDTEKLLGIGKYAPVW